MPIPISNLFAAVDTAAFSKAVSPIFTQIIDPVITLIFAIALVVATYGIISYVWGSNDGEARSRAKMSILGGVVGMFIMMSAWGIVHLIANTIKDFAKSDNSQVSKSIQ